MVQSFEVVIYIFAQQLALNDKQNFTKPTLTVVVELVSSPFLAEHFIHLIVCINNSNISVILQRSVESLAMSGRSFAIGKVTNKICAMDVYNMARPMVNY